MPSMSLGCGVSVGLLFFVELATAVIYNYAKSDWASTRNRAVADEIQRSMIPSDRTSSSLIQRVQLRDEDAWERLVFIYSPLVYAWCRRSRVQEADAADIVQEVFTSVARKIVDFTRERGTGSFRSWLCTITNNKVLDLYRAAQRAAIGVGGSDANTLISQLPSYEQTEPACVAADDQIVLDRVMSIIKSEFEKTTWTAFWRTVVDGVSPAEVAAELSVSRNSVYVSKSRVLHRLREELAGLNDPLLDERTRLTQ